MESLFIKSGTDYNPFRLKGLDNLLESWTDYIFVFSHNIDLSRLRGSLGIALKFFPVFSGRKIFKDDNNFYVDTDCGVLFTSTNHYTDLDFSQDIKNFDKYLCDKTFRKKHRISNTSLKNSLLQIRVNQYSNCVVIGVSVWHAISDGAYFFDFMSCWCEIYRDGDIDKKSTHLEMFEDKNEVVNSIDYSDHVVHLAQNELGLFIEKEMVEETFFLDHDSIYSKFGGCNIDYIIAFFWKKIVEAQGSSSDGYASLHSIYNVRPIVGLSSRHPGNVLYFIETKIPRNNFYGLSVKEIGNCIRKNVFQLISEEGRVEGFLREMSSQINFRNKQRYALLPIYDSLYGAGVIVNNMCGVDFSRLDFGFGCAAKFYSPMEESCRFITIYKDSKTSAIILKIFLPENEMKKLIIDDELKEFI